MSDYKILCTIIILFTTLIISCGSDSPVDPEEENISHGSGVIVNENMGMLLRQGHSLVVFKDKLWMFGGLQHRFGMKDIWYSEDGINWELATEEAEFPARVQHTAFAYDDKMWVIGGSEISDDFNETYIRNDTWYSTDGNHWTQATADADFDPRVGHKSVVFDNKMWVIGGRFWNEETGSGSTKDDVWFSENGIDWTNATDSAGFGNLYYFDCVVFDNKIWLIGGFIIDDISNGTVGTVSKQIWYSSDGVNWQKTDPFFGRYSHANAVFKNKIWGVGGAGAPTNNNDSWYLEFPMD